MVSRNHEIRVFRGFVKVFRDFQGFVIFIRFYGFCVCKGFSGYIGVLMHFQQF